MYPSQTIGPADLSSLALLGGLFLTGKIKAVNELFYLNDEQCSWAKKESHALGLRLKKQQAIIIDANVTFLAPLT
jgi:hypothetical protein